MLPSKKFQIKMVKRSIQKAILDCSIRGLNHTAKWLSELNHSLAHVKMDPSDKVYTDPTIFGAEYDDYFLAKIYFDLREYDRCAYYTEKCTTPVCRFLHFYSTYLSLERKTVENTTEDWPDPKQNSQLQELFLRLKKDYLNWKLDCYMLYLYGVVLKRRDLHNEAIHALVEAVHKDPLHWGAWTELAALIPNVVKLKSLLLPDHWIKTFFLGVFCLEQQRNDDALNIYKHLRGQGFSRSNYVLAQVAIAFHNKRDVGMAISLFHKLRKRDPLRIDNLDILSNLLYVKEMKTELAQLSDHVSEVDKYRPETCCIIGNYYSMRAEHQKAVLYFQRALRLNPQYLSAWTLMGHEFMEMKNTNAAIQSYRQTIEVNRRDYRAWYGLGQTYEVLKMMPYCLYYYQQAQQLRPNDSRMLITLGENYEKLDKVQNALLCYERARNVEDADSTGVATFRLAKLFEKVQLLDQALSVYTEFVDKTDSASCESPGELAHAYKFLANQHLKANQLDVAYQYAQLCLEFEETKEDGKTCLNAIGIKRSQQTFESFMQTDDSTWQQSGTEEVGAPVARVLMFTPEDNQ